MAKDELLHGWVTIFVSRTRKHRASPRKIVLLRGISGGPGLPLKQARCGLQVRSGRCAGRFCDRAGSRSCDMSSMGTVAPQWRGKADCPRSGARFSSTEHEYEYRSGTVRGSADDADLGFMWAHLPSAWSVCGRERRGASGFTTTRPHDGNPRGTLNSSPVFRFEMLRIAATGRKFRKFLELSVYPAKRSDGPCPHSARTLSHRHQCGRGDLHGLPSR